MDSRRKPITLLKDPSIIEAASATEKGLSEKRTLLIIGKCWVEYRGRASSKLESGERILIIKEDGSVLVHRPKDYSPVNWQPPGCIFKTKIVDERLWIRATRLRKKETLEITFEHIYFLAVLDLIDHGKFTLYASEKDMRRAVVANPSLIESGFKPISFEKKVEPGFVDVYGIDKEGRLVVIEIKRNIAGKASVLQLAKYVEAVKVTTNRKIRGILVAPNISKDVQPMLVTLNLEFKPLSPRKCAEILTRRKTRKIVDFLE